MVNGWFLMVNGWLLMVNGWLAPLTPNAFSPVFYSQTYFFTVFFSMVNLFLVASFWGLLPTNHSLSARSSQRDIQPVSHRSSKQASQPTSEPARSGLGWLRLKFMVWLGLCWVCVGGEGVVFLRLYFSSLGIVFWFRVYGLRSRVY